MDISIDDYRRNDYNEKLKKSQRGLSLTIVMSKSIILCELAGHLDYDVKYSIKEDSKTMYERVFNHIHISPSLETNQPYIK